MSKNQIKNLPPDSIVYQDFSSIERRIIEKMMTKDKEINIKYIDEYADFTDKDWDRIYESLTGRPLTHERKPEFNFIEWLEK